MHSALLETTKSETTGTVCTAAVSHKKMDDLVFLLSSRYIILSIIYFYLFSKYTIPIYLFPTLPIFRFGHFHCCMLVILFLD